MLLIVDPWRMAWSRGVRGKQSVIVYLLARGQKARETLRTESLS